MFIFLTLSGRNIDIKYFSKLHGLSMFAAKAVGWLVLGLTAL